MIEHPLDAQFYIETLDLHPHPEGGWYRRTWRAEDGRTERGALSVIYYLLEAHQSCHWHRIDCEEMWLWHAGSTLTLSTTRDQSEPAEERVLGPHMPQLSIPAHLWQSARPNNGWVLVSCVVSPGFDDQGWELAPPGWTPAAKA